MPGAATVPQGELETYGVGKEGSGSGYGTFVAPSIWHCFNKHDPRITTDMITRAPRTSLADPYPGTGGRSVTATLDVETDQDTFPMWLAYALGGQALHPLAMTHVIVNVKTMGMIMMGDSQFTVQNVGTYGGSNAWLNNVSPMANIIVGMTVTVDVGGMNPEPVLITGILGPNQFSIAPATFAHAHSGGSSVQRTSTNGVLNAMNLATPLPSFSVEVGRPSSVNTHYVGGAVDQMTLSMAAKAGLTSKISMVFQDAVTYGGSLTTPVLSSLNPYIFEQQFTYAVMGGEVLGLAGGSPGASLLNFNITINNNLLKGYYTFGTGNRIRSLPEQLRKISGSITLGFETNAQLTNFDVARLGGDLPPISLGIPLVGTKAFAAMDDVYQIYLWMPKIFLSTMNIADDTTKPLQQSFTFTCAESAPGNNDQFAALCIIGANAAF